jgi:hypothetical protein
VAQSGETDHPIGWLACISRLDRLNLVGNSAMTHAEFLHQAVAEIAEELPGFETLDSATQQSLRELGEHYFDDEFVPRLEGIVNIPRYEAAMYERTDSDRAFIADQIGFLRSSIVKAQRAAHRQLVEKYRKLQN